MELCDNCSRTATNVKFYASLDTSLLSVSVHSLLALQDSSLGHNTLKVNHSYSYKKKNNVCKYALLWAIYNIPPHKTSREIYE